MEIKYLIQKNTLYTPKYRLLNCRLLDKLLKKPINLKLEKKKKFEILDIYIRF